MGRYVIGITGASGIILAYKTIAALTEKGHHIDLIMSQYAQYTAAIELGKEINTPKRFVERLPENLHQFVTIHAISDVGASVASGSFQTDGMIIIPCSMTTIAALSIGLGDNAIRRSADVTIKERRPLVLVPRETPFSTIHLENLLKLSRLGATILPPIPAWYNKPQSLEDVENFIVGKVLDTLKIENNLYKRWKS